jgi:hypothetical protein
MSSLFIMTISSDYTEFLITSIDTASATEFATINGFQEGTWFRLPSTLEDQPEAYRQESTPIISRGEWAEMNKEDYDAKSLTGQSGVRILFAQDFATAAKYAAKRNWWLHAWKFVADSETTEVIEYSFFCC